MRVLLRLLRFMSLAVEGSMLQFVADPNSELTAALGMELTDPGPVGVLGPKRTKRFGMYIDDGK